MSEQPNIKNFKYTLHDILKNMNASVYSENEIRNVYNSVNLIDHLIVYNESYIAICDKYIYSKKNFIEQFIYSIDNLSKFINKRIYGIYLTSKNPYNTSFNDLSLTTNLNHVVTIYNEDINNLINDLLSYLYSNNIYVYESETDVYMLDKNTKWLV